MPIVSGQVLFNSNNPAPTTGSAISGVQVALVDTTGNGLIIDTDASGNYSFGTVPAGVYAIVEVFGSPSSGISSGDFSNAAPVGLIIPADPSIPNVPSPPIQAFLHECRT
ncbi:hypothetical protein DVW12_17025 [Clostridium botulinum]|nr:hypothetical protein [Clostridium botulinum]